MVGMSTEIDSYIKKIQSCYDHNAKARVYYEQLIDYLRSDEIPSSSQTHAPCVIQIEPSNAIVSEQSRWSFFQEIPFHDDLLKPTVTHISTNTSIATASPRKKSNGRLFILEGLPSPYWLGRLGARFGIRPELIIEHLELSRGNPAAGSNSNTSTLPSRRKNVYHVRLASIGYTSVHRTVKSYNQERTVATQKQQEWLSSILRDQRYGSTMIRDVHLHDRATFSVEHLVSFCMQRDTNDTWNLVMFLDQGASLPGVRDLPWADYRRGERPPAILPIVPHNYLPMSKNDTRSPVQAKDNITRTPWSASDQLAPFHPRDHLHITTESERKMTSDSPFMLITRLLTVACQSWIQVLSILDTEIEIYQAHLSSPHEHRVANEHLQFVSAYVDRIRDYVARHKSIGTSVRQFDATSTLPDDVAELQRLLDEDHEHLLQHCNETQRKASSTRNSIVQASQLLQSQKSLDEAAAVTKLTKLAFIFIPSTFIATLFGMNVTQIEQSTTSIWLYFAVAVPFALSAYLLAEHMSRLEALLKPIFNRLNCA